MTRWMMSTFLGDGKKLSTHAERGAQKQKKSIDPKKLEQKNNCRKEKEEGEKNLSTV